MIFCQVLYGKKFSVCISAGNWMRGKHLISVPCRIKQPKTRTKDFYSNFSQKIVIRLNKFAAFLKPFFCELSKNLTLVFDYLQIFTLNLQVL